MSERKDEKWLDSQLQRAINGSTPAFDAQAWKQKHSEEYRILMSRRGESKPSAFSAGRTVQVILGSWIGRLAVAAVIAVAVGLFVLSRGGHGPDEPPVPPGPMAHSSPANMMSMMSLRMAYQRGGFDAVDRQLQDTLDEFRPRSSSVPIRGLFSM